MGPQSNSVYYYKCIGCRKFLPRDKGLAFHTLPKDTGRARKWLEILGREDLQYELHKRHVVCSEHFDPCMFKETIGRKLLTADAMPSPGPVHHDPSLFINNNHQQDEEPEEHSMTIPVQFSGYMDYDEPGEEEEDEVQINTYKEALNYLGPLEQFALMQENVRLLGLINQIENIFRHEIENGNA